LRAPNSAQGRTLRTRLLVRTDLVRTPSNLSRRPSDGPRACSARTEVVKGLGLREVTGFTRC
jgi:hypothetical protein